MPSYRIIYNDKKELLLCIEEERYDPSSHIFPSPTAKVYTHVLKAKNMKQANVNAKFFIWMSFFDQHTVGPKY